MTGEKPNPVYGRASSPNPGKPVPYPANFQRKFPGIGEKQPFNPEAFGNGRPSNWKRAHQK